MKNRPKKSVLRHFLGNFDQKIAFFFRRALPSSKLVYIDAKGALRKFSKVHHQKWISQNRTSGDPLGRQGVESLRGGGGGTALDSEADLVFQLWIFKKVFNHFQTILEKAHQMSNVFGSFLIKKLIKI